MKVVPALKWFHNWVGFFISITMLIVLTTGVYLGGMDILKRIDDHGQTFVALNTVEKAQILQTIFERYPQMSSVRFPTEHTPYIEAATRGKSIALDTQLNELAIHANHDIAFYSTMFWLHRNFLLDDVGKYTNAWASLAGGVITLVGIYLWWRVRKGFRLKHSIPTDTRSSSLVKSHIQLGLFISVPLFILCLSGFLITYKGLWTGHLQHQAEETLSYPSSKPNDWLSQLETAQRLWPQAILVSVNKPRGSADESIEPADLIYSIRFDSHSDVWLRQADNITMNYNTGKIESALKYSDRALSGRIASFVRPLHDALNMPLSYVVLITSISIVAIFILLFSTVTFYRRTFKSKTATR
ncbi:PepSY-associated TM helix domain-containing protein [Shewanella sp. ULN5]|uniref:PepSY-associated TM helix domain-containing protein n=1 Tax=Shewanella sp. ULN5 TaxID=2994678 RepID=UPI00273DAA3E|nr:PepSY-associated TM helix domain-containing protein [Shewanella sp. ULN5]MDP5146406.1 PepSY-associated TM helix domain-containing protein [Shewanella sp. ULN5]